MYTGAGRIPLRFMRTDGFRRPTARASQKIMSVEPSTVQHPLICLYAFHPLTALVMLSTQPFHSSSLSMSPSRKGKMDGAGAVVGAAGCGRGVAVFLSGLAGSLSG